MYIYIFIINTFIENTPQKLYNNYKTLMTTLIICIKTFFSIQIFVEY